MTQLKTVSELAEEYALNHNQQKCPACGEQTLWATHSESFKAGFDAAIEMLRGEGAYYSLVNDDLRVDHCADWLERQRDNK